MLTPTTGNGGSPVFRKDDLVSMGVHICGGWRMAAAAQHELPIFIMARSNSGQESIKAGSVIAQEPPQVFAADALAHRALVADAAL